MGSYDGAETCKHIGTYLLNKIKHLFNNEIGLYRDDSFAILRNTPASEANRTAKKLCAEFKNYGLNITVDQGLKVVNFLDVTLNLNNTSYRPYSKPNNTKQYVNRVSSHPENIIITIPKSVYSRLSNISSK